MPDIRCTSRRLIHAAVVLLATLLPGFAHASFFVWVPVTLDKKTGASCGDGSPYTFFVNRNPMSRNLSVVFEPGGICGSGDTCAGDDGERTAFNPNGVPTNYMRAVDQGFAASISPMTRRLAGGVSSTEWNMVFLPYCTGDQHLGTAVNAYTKKNGDVRIQHHVGLNNMKAVADWMKTHGFANPPKLLVNGMSAGSMASPMTYAYLRRTLNAAQGYMIADSAFWTPMPRGASEDVAPAVKTFEFYERVHGWRAKGGLLDMLLAQNLKAFDPLDMGSIYRANSTTFPRDRFTYLGFQEDENLPVSGLLLNSSVQAIPEWNGAARRELRKSLYRSELMRTLEGMSHLPNFGYWVPLWRAGNSHCVTLVTFLGTSIEELGRNDARLAIESTLDDSKPMIRAIETDQTGDYSRSRWYNFAFAGSERLFATLLDLAKGVSRK